MIKKKCMQLIMLNKFCNQRQLDDMQQNDTQRSQDSFEKL